MRNRKAAILLTALFLIPLTTVTAYCRGTDDKPKEAGYAAVKEYILANASYKYVLAREGEFVAVFNEGTADWIKEKLDKELIMKIRDNLRPYLAIALNSRGLAPAAARAVSGEKDETNYDAIWVRDNVWVYYSLLKDPGRRDDARKLLLALWDYYATGIQVDRFRAVIADPKLSLDQMAMPHIRFNGSSPDLEDVMIDGRPEIWNHRQMDAHGIFFTALGEAFAERLISADDMTEKRFRVLSLYPLFLQSIPFYDYEDAGSWEEIPRKNTSSIGLATRSLQVWKRLIYDDMSRELKPLRDKFTALIKNSPKYEQDGWSAGNLSSLASRGLETVKYQLRLGGESPDYAPDDIRFRRADAALIFLIQPSQLEGLTEDEMRKALLIVETLKRPMGVLRYDNDSYQAGNYWVTPPSGQDKDKPALTGDTSSKDAFLWRLSKLTPNTEAQWFFDSLLASAHLHLAEITERPEMARQDIFLATVHLKRALGQITGGAIASDGKPVKPWQPPESINTVVVDGHRYYLPSPITPLNWAKAALSSALYEYERVAIDKFGQ